LATDAIAPPNDRHSDHVEAAMKPRPFRRRRDMCPYIYRAALIEQGFAWLGAEIGLFVDIRHPIAGRYFEPLRDDRRHVLRTETLAALILWRAETIAIANRTSSACIRIADGINIVAA
jgi:hypothetical protein